MKAQLGPGRLLIAVYGVFALSATARASFQLITKFEEAPLAYVTVGFELVGVLAVGLMSLLLPELFAHPSVWSLFGAGYAFIPLALPILGLIWLRRQDARN